MAPNSLSSANDLAVLLLLLALGCFLLPLRAVAFDFDVGGKDGWVVPSAKDAGVYNDWASKNRFQVGDIIHFKYKKDSVLVVSEEDYNKCRSTHPIFFSNNGATQVRLDRPGLFHFISGVAGHCQRGQRMALRVMSPAAAPPPPPAPPQPSTPPQPSAAAAAAGLIGAGALGAAVGVFLVQLA